MQNRVSNKNLNQDEKTFVREFINPPQLPLTIININEELSRNFGVKNKKREIKDYIKDYIKTNLNYSNKRGGSTTFKGGSDRIKYQQSILSSRLLIEILNRKLIINIDEWSFYPKSEAGV